MDISFFSEKAHSVFLVFSSFRLDFVVGLHIDDGLMGSFHMVLRKLAIVIHFAFRDVVLAVGLLEQEIASVGVVFQNAANSLAAPPASHAG